MVFYIRQTNGFAQNDIEGNIYVLLQYKTNIAQRT